MHISRLSPTVADLTARAIAATRFAAEVTADEPLALTTGAQLAAGLAAEYWERDAGVPIGCTVPRAVIAETTAALVAHGAGLLATRLATLYAAAGRLEAAITALAQARTDIKERLPVVAAEALMDHIEDHFDAIRVKMQRALELVMKAIDSAERAQ